MILKTKAGLKEGPEIGRPRSMGWKNIGRRWTRGVGGYENWTTFMDVVCLLSLSQNQGFQRSLSENTAAWKVSVFKIFLVSIFPHSDGMRRFTPEIFVFNPNAENYGPEKLWIRTPFTYTVFWFGKNYFLQIRKLLLKLWLIVE